MSARLTKRSRYNARLCVLVSKTLFTITNGEQVKLSGVTLGDGPVLAPTERPETSHHFAGQLQANIPFIPSDIKVDSICQ